MVPFNPARYRDLTGAVASVDETPIATEYTIPTKTKLLHLGLYFLLNLSLTLYNKAVLQKFTYPWTLTAIHAGSASLGCYILLLRDHFQLAHLSRHEKFLLGAFSLLFTINIAMSNVSLALVSVPFHQIMRSTCPVFTILIYRIFYARTYSQGTYLSLIPLILGVGVATFGDYYFSTLGFILTLAGVLLATIKTVVSNRLMTGSLALHPLEILLRMSPLAALQSIIYAYFAGELGALSENISTFTALDVLLIAGNGFIAFALNVSSFNANKLAGALTMTVCANVKQCLTILLGIVIFNVKVGIVNGIGIVIALAGAAFYSRVELSTKMAKQQRSQTGGDEEERVPMIQQR
ncbi:uncharacterized protein K452DRAFT_281401 [Aplosporella prunicola CBS 121167]|uniref:Sugar phosphate transporter domain-containing protein n=1 Tax=Aplosporella prunicola CBS 121167 TaxID=1176127 RepID=A0A6A6AU45_9PEZI|nr:uncharacterized protein K452DRAFT_281401 [Aplosporella prunicola CBS 121167]KAF2135532.1 hypothetical protein K452DRAFT_281401 [Aplosporella prunicola CBS 121167]